MILSESHFKSEIFSSPIIKPKPDDLLFYTNCFIKLKPDNTTIQAAKLTAQENINITAGNPPSPEGYGRTGNLLILASQDFSTSSETNKSKTTYSKSIGTSGSINTEILSTEISSLNQNPIKLKLDAGNLIYAEYNSNSNPLNNSTTSTTSSLAYLQSLDPTKAIFNPLTEIHQSYDQTNRSLTQTSQALIAIGAVAIAIGTGGIGTGISGAILTAGATTAGTIATTSATNASMNADGNFLKQGESIVSTSVKDTTSKESLQQIAIAAAAAGLAQGAMQASGLSNSAKVVNTTNATNTTTSTIERVATNFSTGLQKAAIHSTSNIIATSAIKGQSINQTITEQGGGEKIFLNTALNALAETGAKEIGILAHAGEINKVTQLTLHGIVGCAVGSASGNCAAGAAGAIAGEVAGEIYFKNQLEKNGIQVAKLDANGNQITDPNQSGRETILLNSSSPEAYNQQLQTLSQIKLQTVELSKLIGAAAAIPFATANGKDDASAIYAGVGAARNSVGNNSIEIAIQPVSLGYSHASVKHEVEAQDEKFFETDPRYRRNAETGKLYMTFGGGPDPFLSNLIGDANRNLDVNTTNKIYESQNLVPASSDVYQASRLYQLNQSYKDNLPYEFFPTKTSEGYNSNSYAAGILNAADITPPTLPKYITNPTPWQDWEYPEYSPKISYPVPLVLPGYDKPVPKEFFGVKE